jgi:protein ImuB
MGRRFVSIWFRHLKTDWFALRDSFLRRVPFVLRTPSHGRMVITAINEVASKHGIAEGMVLADARVLVPGLRVEDDISDLPLKLLSRLGEWCIRFSPFVALDLPDGLIIESTGCSHLWGSDEAYVEDITKKLNERGYDVRVSMADTPTVAWGVARFGNEKLVVQPGQDIQAILSLPPEALRLEQDTIGRLHQLGLNQVKQFIKMPRASLRRRFGNHLIRQIDFVLGKEQEVLEPIQPIEPFQERLPCLEPIVNATGIEIALEELLKKLCHRLQQEQMGLRDATLKCYRVDGKVEQISISTNSPSYHVKHIYKLFEIKLPSIEPALGIELFVLEANKVEGHLPQQEKMWKETGGLEDEELSELLDRLSNKIGSDCICRYLPDEHHWPEHSYKRTTSLQEKLSVPWKMKPRPLHVLSKPERVEVTAPIPDYPPMLFRRKGKIHKIVKADGPERIEQEWWISQGQHRDYYRVEDEEGRRYWIFRSGHYDEKNFQWYLHGFFP